MGKNRIFIYIAFGVFVIFGMIMMIAGPDEIGGPDSQEDDEAAAVSALFGGGGGSPDQRELDSDFSVTESDLWKAGVGDTPIQTAQSDEPGETDILDPASAGNPVNPQTGQPYTDSMMRQFDTLREKFPENEIIPRRKSPEEQAEEKEAERQMNQVRRDIASKKATEADVTAYYDYKKKMVEDRLELIDYVLKTQGDKMSDDIKAQYQKVLDMNQKQLDSYNKSQERDLKRISQ
jgi:hypothetical protein